MTSRSRRLVLASTSAYRKALLERLRLPFETASPAIDESGLPGEAPSELVLRLAEAKARAVASRHPDSLVIGSDQVAEFEGRAIGKPADHADAFRQLKSMAGRMVVFYTGLVLLDASSGRCQRALVAVESSLRALSDEAIETYLRIDRPYDCAGSIKVETIGISLFTRVASDDPTALIGLPLIRLTDMLIAEGLDPLSHEASGSVPSPVSI